VMVEGTQPSTTGTYYETFCRHAACVCR
jgi:hypothetical protein